MRYSQSEKTTYLKQQVTSSSQEINKLNAYIKGGVMSLESAYMESFNVERRDYLQRWNAYCMDRLRELTGE
jgi:hypothetical protein